jgi:hypothetical protein
MNCNLTGKYKQIQMGSPAGIPVKSRDNKGKVKKNHRGILV